MLLKGGCMSSMSLAEYRELFLQQPNTKSVRNKFNVQKIKLDGMTFDSKKELQRYIELKAMQQRGDIYDLCHHTKFELIPKVKLQGEKKTKPAIRYYADFTYYTANNEYVVEDVKSKVTRKLAVYRQKKHLMKSIHNIDIKET